MARRQRTQAAARPPAPRAVARREALEHVGRGWFKTPLGKHFARGARR